MYTIWSSVLLFVTIRPPLLVLERVILSLGGTAPVPLGWVVLYLKVMHLFLRICEHSVTMSASECLPPKKYIFSFLLKQTNKPDLAALEKDATPWSQSKCVFSDICYFHFYCSYDLLLFTLYCLLFTLYYCMMYTLYCLLYTVYCILYTVYCLLYTVYY